MKHTEKERKKNKNKECCLPDWSSFLSLAEILRVHLSCHLYCNCPLFCHSDYTQQGHANEELKIGCLKVRSMKHQSLSRYVVQFPLQKPHQKLNGNEAWLDKKKKNGKSLRAHCGKHETKAWGRYLPGSVGECWVASSHFLSWSWCLHPATPHEPFVPGATLRTQTHVLNYTQLCSVPQNADQFLEFLQNIHA